MMPTLARAGLAFVLALLVTLAVPSSAAPPARTTYLPVAQGGNIAAVTQMVYACQCGAVSLTVRGNGSLYLTILDHSRGGRVVVGTYDGVTFKELPNALPFFPGEPLPSYEYPGIKQGIGDTADAFGKMVTCAPNRTEEGGNYNIWCAVSPQP
jgi:hypothetical protein